MYACFVQEITIFPPVSVPMPSVWTELETLLPENEWILPCLRVVDVSSRHPYLEMNAGDRGQLALLSPSVREVTLIISNPDENKDEFCDAFRTRCPNLQTVFTEVSWWTGLLSQHTQLRTLWFSQIMGQCVAKAAQLVAWPALESLSFEVSRFCKDPPHFPFRLSALRTLSIGDMYGNTLPFFTHMQLPALRTLSYEFDPSKFLIGAHAPLGALAAAYPHLSTLNLFVVHSRHIFANTPLSTPECLLLRDLLRPLTPIRDLRALLIYVGGHLLLYGPKDLRAIAAAWPALLELKIGATSQPELASTRYEGDLEEEEVTRDALAELARAMPDLCSLRVAGIALDWRELEFARYGA
ncbi:uncharacterized protein BXZ73DRAFT_81508 [Epithele typhae]|uniref:uncharacterized protein n=1 Tax=Epithele typhae TaxID=378194 RepID=UPI002008E02A|nr:uncharacterized protein BXZ73DRAFT_81508 [Epithele typhae]KAH9914899.1 hypothetical protein BXZ73DRAFT_81508 [Epithele typhae]